MKEYRTRYYLRFIALFLLLFFVKNTSSACLNEETEELNIFVKRGISNYVPLGHEFIDNDFDKLILLLKEKAAITEVDKNGYVLLNYSSDMGYVMILQKKYKEALQLYFDIEKKEANRYSTASNVGTIYELIGDNQKALEWIKKSVLIDSSSHNNSEWLHIKILEAKIKGTSAYNSNFLLGTDFGVDKKPSTKLSAKELDRLKLSLYFQLNERVTFIKPQDAIVGLLLFELGNVLLVSSTDIQAVKANYELAQKYGYDTPILQKRLSYVNNMIENKSEVKVTEKTNSMSFSNIALLLTCLALIVFIVYVLKYRDN